MRIKKEVLICGGFHPGAEEGIAANGNFFEQIARRGKSSGVNISIVEEKSLSSCSWKKAEEIMSRADLLVMGVGRPTTDAGILGGMGNEYNKPIVLVYPKGKVVSRIARGNPAVVAEVVYSHEEEALEALGTIFEWLREIQGGRKRKRLEVLLFKGSLPEALQPAAD